jgi:hypothetical protein
MEKFGGLAASVRRAMEKGGHGQGWVVRWSRSEVAGARNVGHDRAVVVLTGVAFVVRHASLFTA